MRKFSHFVSMLLLTSAAVLAGSFGGCHSCDGGKSSKDIPPGAIPQPCGTYNCQWINEQNARANRDQLVIYQYEWTADGVHLTDFGRNHIRQMTERLQLATDPVVIEPSSSQTTNDSRQKAVIAEFASLGWQVPAERIAFGHSEAEGLRGAEAAGIANQMQGSRSGQATASSQNSNSSTGGGRSSFGNTSILSTGGSN
jgi:hypothetical protein